MNDLLKKEIEPSLERMVLTKISISLWNWEVSTLSWIHLQESEEIIAREWQRIEDNVLEKVPQLLLPQPLKGKVLCLIKPTGIEILKWIRFHHKNCYFSGILPNDLCWTNQGTIDKMKTATLLIEDENLDIIERYRLACTYCLEEKISHLWRRIPDNFKYTGNFMDSTLIYFWTYYSKIGKSFLSFRAMCRPALLSVNKDAVEFFFSKLTPGEREQFFSSFAHTLDLDNPTFSYCYNTSHYRKYIFDVLWFSLSQMTEEQQANFFRKYSFIVLSYFLNWPRQSFFMEMVNYLQSFLSDKAYIFLLRRIIRKITKGFIDYNYQELFVEVWKQSPASVKSYVLQVESAFGIQLTDLFKIKHEAIIKSILKSLTEKKRFFGITWNVILQNANK